MSETRETEAGVITSEFNQNEQRLKQILHPEENFDIIIRRIQIGGRAAALYYASGNGYAKGSGGVYAGTVALYGK